MAACEHPARFVFVHPDDVCTTTIIAEDGQETITEVRYSNMECHLCYRHLPRQKLGERTYVRPFDEMVMTHEGMYGRYR